MFNKYKPVPLKPVPLFNHFVRIEDVILNMDNIVRVERTGLRISFSDINSTVFSILFEDERNCSGFEEWYSPEDFLEDLANCFNRKQDND